MALVPGHVCGSTAVWWCLMSGCSFQTRLRYKPSSLPGAKHKLDVDWMQHCRPQAWLSVFGLFWVSLLAPRVARHDWRARLLRVLAYRILARCVGVVAASSV